MPKLPKISIQATRLLDGEPRFYAFRDEGERWNENSITIRVLNWLIFIERRPTAEDLAADRARVQAEIAASLAERGRVFDGLRTDMFGYHSDALSDFVSRQMTALGIKTSKTSFHSLRHNFQDACRFAEVDKVVTEALAGREEGGTGGGYGSGKFSLRQLNDSLQRVSFPALNLKHLPIY